MPFGLGFGETILILAVILLFFGPKRLPEAASSLGKGIREFKRAVGGIGEELASTQHTIAPPPLPPHSTLAGTGADPHAVAAEPHAPPAAPEAGESAAADPKPDDAPVA